MSTTSISHRDLKAASHTFMLSLLTARMKHIPGREQRHILTMKDIRAQVLLALRSRLATANMFLLCYQKCYATGPVAWPKNSLFKFTQSKQGTLDSRNQALLMMAVAGTVSQYEVKGDMHCTPDIAYSYPNAPHTQGHQAFPKRQPVWRTWSTTRLSARTLS